LINANAGLPLSLAKVTEMLAGFPGVGPKTALRLSLHLLGRPAGEVTQLAEAISELHENVGFCSQCGCFSERGHCNFCDSLRRNSHLVCIVEQPVDVLMIERGGFEGCYHVLHGRLSPVDSIGPENLRLDALDAHITGGDIHELILATSATVDGEATAHYLSHRYAEFPVIISRISRGVPEGGELEYLDEHTLHRAISQRVVWEGRKGE